MADYILQLQNITKVFCPKYPLTCSAAMYMRWWVKTERVNPR